MNSPTIYICGKCGAREEMRAALSAGWQIENRLAGGHGLKIRCPSCRGDRQ
jgi:DNA-directed RNA polymerase subunit RPC12/RpoP